MPVIIDAFLPNSYLQYDWTQTGMKLHLHDMTFTSLWFSPMASQLAGGSFGMEASGAGSRWLHWLKVTLII